MKAFSLPMYVGLGAHIKNHDYLHSVIFLKLGGNFTLIFRTANVLLVVRSPRIGSQK